jgi:RimJ/RimL family protein N-acetyltransferase
VSEAGTRVQVNAATGGGPRLATPRLVLRPFRPGDVDELLTMDGDARVMRYIGTGLLPRTRDEVAASIGRIIDFAARRPGMSLLHASERDTGRFVGGCGLFPLPDDSAIEIAYRLPHACWGRGYATEMARAVLAHGFDTLRLERIVGVTYPENEPSQRVLLKLGMRAEGEAVHYGRTMRVFAAERATFGGGA